MGLVFVTKTPHRGHEYFEGRASLATIWEGATYFFLYPGILRLKELTGELIDSQQDAYFTDSALDHLEAFVKAEELRTIQQPETWQQRVGTRGSEPVYELATREDVLDLLSCLRQAVKQARQDRAGVFFYGQ